MNFNKLYPNFMNIAHGLSKDNVYVTIIYTVLEINSFPPPEQKP